MRAPLSSRAAALAVAAALALAPAAAAPGQQRLLLAGAPGGALPPLSGPSSYTSVCNRLSFPGSVPITAGASTQSNFSAIGCVSPPYAVSNVKSLFVGFYISVYGGPNPETCLGNGLTIDFETIMIGGTAYPVTFGGAQSGSVANCGFAWSDALKDSQGHVVTIPPNTTFAILTSQTAPLNGQLAPNGVHGLSPDYSGPSYGQSPNMGDFTGFYSAPQTQWRLGVSLPTFDHWGSNVVGPSMMIGTGWNGSAVYGVVGDSICFGQNDNDFTPPSLGGAILRALDDTPSGRRNAYSLCVDGTAPETQSSTAPGQFALRMAAIRSIGNFPFNVLFSDMGSNSPTMGLSGPSGLAQFEAVETAWWRFWRGLCPSCKIVQTTQPSHAYSTNHNGLTTQAEQNSDYPNGVRWLSGTWIKTGPLPYGVVGIDTTTAFTTGSGYTDNAGNWPITGWSGTLAAAVSSSVSAVTVAAATKPSVGDDLVIDVGSSAVESLGIWQVTGSASPWTVQLVGNTHNTHANGAAVGLALTQDGTHPSASLYKAAAAALIALKGGVLP